MQLLAKALLLVVIPFAFLVAADIGNLWSAPPWVLTPAYTVIGMSILLYIYSRGN